MAYQTPAERRARAQENISSENGISLLGAYNTARVAKQEAQREAEREQELAKLDEVRTNPIVRALASLGDLSWDVVAGTGRWLEGLIDFTASTNGWMFGKNIREKTKEFVAKDLTAMWYDDVQKWHDDSYFKEGGFVEQVGQGVGQILPAVIIGVATGGAGAAASAAGQAVSTAALAASAAGNATGEAWQEGAGYGQGLAYGAATGAVEALTERMTGGASKAVYGAGYLDNIIGKAGKSAAGKFAGNVAETGIKRIAKNMVEEAVEEGVAELASPALKSIYKGKEAFKEYTEGDYWKQVGQAAAVGGVTAGVFGETIGRTTAVASGGKAGDISNAVEELGAIKTKAQNLQARGQLDPNDPSLLQAKKKNYQIIENTLQKAKPAQREKLINRFGLSKDFDSNGEMNAMLKQRLGLVQATEQGSSTPSSALTSDQKRYVSYTAWEDGERIKEDLSAMRDQLEEKGIKVDSVEINDTPLTAQQEENFQYYTKAVNKFGEVSGLDLDFVVVKPTEGVNAGIIKGTNTFYISAKSLKNEQWMKDFVHETLHTTEGTEGWKKLVKYMTEELGLDKQAAREAIDRGYDTENETEMVTEMASIEAEYALGNEEFIKRFVGSDKQGFARLFERIHELVKVFKQIKTPEGKKQYEQLKNATKLYIKAAQESGDIRLLHLLGAIENDEEVDIESLDNERSVQFDLKGKKTLSAYVDDILSMSDAEALRNKENGLYVSVLGKTPQVILDNVPEAQGREIIISFHSLYLATRSRGVLEGNYHNMGDVVKRLPDFLNDPIAIVRMKNGRLNLYAIVEDEAGKPTLISVELNREKQLGKSFDKYHLVITVFSPKINNIKNNLRKNAEALLYKKTDSSQVKLQQQEWMEIFNDESIFNKSISQEEDIVKQNKAKFSLKLGGENIGSKGRYQFDIASEQMLTDIMKQNDISNFLPQGIEEDFARAIARSGNFAYPRLYRGMEQAELDFIKKNGYIKSNGEYNFSYQQGETFFSHDITTSFSYATSFAPNAIREKFFEQGKPAYIVEVSNEDGYRFKNDGVESSTKEQIPVGLITRVIELKYNKTDGKVYAKDVEIEGMGEWIYEAFGVPSFYQDKTTGAILYNVPDAYGEESSKYISEAAPWLIYDYDVPSYGDGDSFAKTKIKYANISGNESDLVPYSFDKKKTKAQFSFTPAQLRSAYSPQRQVQFNLAYVEQHKADLRKAYTKKDSKTGKLANKPSIPLETLMKSYDKVLEIWDKLGGVLNSEFIDKWNKRIGKDEVFKVFKEQVGYKYNIELSTMCKKGVPLFEAINEIVKQEALAELKTDRIDADSKKILYAILTKKGYDIPCAICYVEQARQRESQIISNFLDGIGDKTKKGYKMGWNAVLHEIESLMKEYGVDYKFGAIDNSIASTTYQKQSVFMTAKEQEAFYKAMQTVINNEVRRYNKFEAKDESKYKKELESTSTDAIKKWAKGQRGGNMLLLKLLLLKPDSRLTIKNELLLSSVTTTNLAKYFGGDGSLYSLFNSQGGSGGYKLKQTPIVYWGEILKKNGKLWSPSAIRNGGGIRNQSNSDFQMYTLIDQMQIYADLTARGYYLHAYTKVLSELKIFGKSRAKINASLIPAVVLRYKMVDGKRVLDVEATKEWAGLDENGKPVYDDNEGIPSAEAFVLLADPEYSKNITGICIGYSDRHIQALLEDKRIQLIIGFHDKTDDGSKRYKGAEYSHNYNGENEAYDPVEDKVVTIHFSDFLSKAEEMFGYDTETETFNKSDSVEFNGKTYAVNDIPKLAADLYLEHCRENGYIPAYSGRGREGAIDFSKHENYYKLLGDFGLYDSQGNYAPHRKVALNVPETVPALDANGNVIYESTESLIKRELEAELEVRDQLAYDLADESGSNIIGKFGEYFRKLQSGEDLNSIIKSINTDEEIEESIARPKKTTRKAQMSLMPKYEYRNGKQLELNAELNKSKAYSRKDASELLNSILDEYLSFGETYGELRGKSRSAVIDAMWQNFNSNDKNRNKTARDIAEYIVEQAILEDPAMDEIKAMHMETLDILRDYRKSIDLKSIKGDIKSRFGNDNSPFNRWGARKTTEGIGLQNLKNELEGRGIRIVAENSADIFFAIDDMYTQSLKIVKERKKKIAEDLTEGEVSQLKSDLAQAVLNAYYDGGHIGKVRQIINDYRTKIRDLSRRLTAKNSLVFVAQDIKNWKKGAFVNASTFKTDIFKKSLERLSNLTYRGNLNASGFREIIKDIRSWYDAENPIFKNQVNEVGEGGYVPITAYNQEVADALEMIANGKGDITIEEMQSAEAVLRYFKRFMEHYNKVVRNGKLVEAKPIAEEAIEDSKKNARNQDTVIARVIDTFRDAFVDPMTIMRRMDGYKEGGFFTTTLNELRYGLIATKAMQRKLLNPLVDFYDKHKDFQKTIQNKTVTYNGQQLPAAIAMQLYMTLHRDQALRGLALNGFEYKQGKQAVATKVKGFAKGQIFDPSDIDAELKVLAKEQIEALASQFTALEMEYIHTVEQAYEECKDIKRETDMNRMGYTNVIDGYYVPIRRAIGKPISLEQSWMDDANSAGNPSFNKDTVKGAAGALYLDAVDVVVDKHITAMSMYANLTTAIDNYNTLVNLDISGNPNDPVSLRKSLPQVWANGFKYLNNLMKDVQGVGGESSIFNSLYGELRGAWATAQLAANPKVWVTQLSSIPAAISILKPTSILKSVGVSGADVDQYCELAAIRNDENTAAMAQGVFDKSKNPSLIKRIGEWLMKPIGKVDRWVIQRHFAACQVEIAETKGLAIGTEANKIEAGKLLTKVILETQQNSLATERSAAMRSKSEFARSVTMFTSDAMKVVGRVMDSVGEWLHIKKSIRNTTDSNEIASLNKKLAQAGKKIARSSAALASTAVFMALLAQAFRWLRAQDDDDENIAKNMALDAIGNMLGGLPIIKDVYGFFINGYELEGFNYSVINDTLTSVKSCFTAIGDGVNGDTSKIALAMKNMFVALGNMLGLPVRNVYNYATGITKRISPSAGYKIDDFFYNKSYRSDLEKAVNKGDEKMVATIASLMLNENVGGIEDKGTREAMNDLILKGYSVIPSGVPESFTYEEEEYKLTKTQKKTWERIYNGANEVVADMVALTTYENATDEVKAQAINFVYKMYRNLAIQAVLGEDLETKSVLFAEAFPIEKLALIVAQANVLEADKDKNGVAISGTKKAKVQAMVAKLKLTAAEKYMVMGYLGYTNTNGEEQVKKYINRLNMTESEKQKLLAYSGYKVA